MATEIDIDTFLTPAEQQYIEDELAGKSKEEILAELKQHLQTAVEIELATIPIYLYTYYSVERNERTGQNMKPADLFADMAGGVTMSVAVEEMLHLSLSSNIYFALTGEPPELYGRSPGPYPTALPHHNPQGPPGPGGQTDTKVLIPLAKLGYDQLWHFLQIEYPEGSDAPPQGSDWDTIGQFYSYIRCLIAAPQVTDDDFTKGDPKYQIQPYNFSPNSIDTAYPKSEFDPWGFPPPPGSSSGQAASNGEVAPNAAAAAVFTNNPHAHEGPQQTELQTVTCKVDALYALATICDQGEGFQHERYDDPEGTEESHYYKFLTLQSMFPEYVHHRETLPDVPAPPPVPEQSISEQELAEVVVNFPTNPTAAYYEGVYSNLTTAPKVNYQPLADFVSGVYQYMLILTESIFKVKDVGDDVPGSEVPVLENQKLFFNLSMHQTMIWLLDKIVQGMRALDLGNGQKVAPTFENIDLGDRGQAFEHVVALGRAMAGQPYYENFKYYVDMAAALPDVSTLWGGKAPPKPHPPKQEGPGYPVPKPYPYADLPPFPKTIGPQPEYLPLHACMGLNSCRASDRYGLAGRPTKDNPTPTTANPGPTNDCAGMGYCSTTADHTCHVKNECRNQGGCGLYGTADELDHPTRNACKGLGSCATPINAERFSTNGTNQGKSVWVRARQVFAERYAEELPKLRAHVKDAPDGPGPAPAPFTDTGPSYLWISHDNTERSNMTACGSSGLSGAGGCA